MQRLSIILDPVNGGRSTLMDVQALNENSSLYDPHQCILKHNATSGQGKQDADEEWRWFGLNPSSWHGYRIKFDNSGVAGYVSSGAVEQINMKTGARLTVPMLVGEDLTGKPIETKFQVVVDRVHNQSLLVYLNEKSQAEHAYFFSGYLLSQLEDNEILYAPRYIPIIYHSNSKILVANFGPFAKDGLQRWVCDLCLLVMISRDRIVCFQPDGIGLYELNGTRLDFRLSSEFTIDITPVAMLPYMFVHYLPHFDVVLEASPDRSLRLWHFTNNQIQLCCTTTTTENTEPFDHYRNHWTGLLISKDPQWEQECIADLSMHLRWIRSLVDLVYNYVV